MADERIHRIETKVDKIGEDLTDIKVTLVAQHESLKEHIRRTELLEETVVPIQKKVHMLDGAMKLAGIAGASVGVILAMIEIAKYIMELK